MKKLLLTTALLLGSVSANASIVDRAVTASCAFTWDRLVYENGEVSKDRYVNKGLTIYQGESTNEQHEVSVSSTKWTGFKEDAGTYRLIGNTGDVIAINPQRIATLTTTYATHIAVTIGSCTIH